MFGIDISILIVVLVLIFGDVVTGLIKAFATDSFNSSEMRKGMWHKAGSVALLLLAAFVTVACQYVDVFPAEFAIVYVPTCLYIACMELASILENIVEINPELDKFKIFQIFGQTKNDDDSEGGEA